MTTLHSDSLIFCTKFSDIAPFKSNSPILTTGTPGQGASTSYATPDQPKPRPSTRITIAPSPEEKTVLPRIFASADLIRPASSLESTLHTCMWRPCS